MYTITDHNIHQKIGDISSKRGDPVKKQRNIYEKH